MSRAGRVNVLLYDSGGNLVLNVTEDLGGGPAAVALDIGSLRRGVYFYRVNIRYGDGNQRRLPGGRFSVL
jgi:hypothetical protein